ncbi:MAG: hypothetical protein AB7I19_09680 [Planctomycetota bacterium]
MRNSLVGVLSLLAASSSLMAQQTWTVASGGGAQFREISAAVVAAADGDLVVVAPGVYGPVVIDGKGLTIVGRSESNGIFVSNPGFAPFATPPAITIRNLNAQQHVHLSRMQVFNFGAPRADLLVHDCAGTVWLEELFCDSYGAPALVAERCANLVVVATTAQTNATVATPSGVPLPGPGARLVDTSMHAYDSQFRGAHTILELPGFPTAALAVDGGNGIEVAGSFLQMQGCDAQGGGPSARTRGGCLLVGNGGDGIVLTRSPTAASELRLRSTVAGGARVWSTGPFCGAPPTDGIAVRSVGGRVIELSGEAHALRGGGDLVSPTTVQMEVTGTAGDFAALLVSSPVPALELLGLSLHTGPGWIDLGSAVVDRMGKANFAFAVPPLSPSLPPILAAVQAVVLDRNGDLVTSGPATLVLR